MKYISVIIFSLFIAHSAYSTPVNSIPLTTDNGPIKLSDYKGQIVYLDFWASWCIPCRKSFPWMNSIQKKYADKGVKVIAVNLDQEHRKAKIFLEKIPANFTIVFDPEGISAKAFEVKGMPSTYLIDRDGNIFFSHVGFREKEIPAMENKIKQILKR